MKSNLKIPSIDQVNIRPGVNILSILRHINYKPWFALAEFVDNAIQNYKQYEKQLKNTDKKYKLKVKIEIDSEDGGCIIVRDNAAGIHQKDYQRAFRAAEIPPDTTGLSEFGMGMKSAACWFSSNWKVRTKALGENIEREVHFDIEKIVHDNLSELKVKPQSSKPEYHFTEITLSSLYRIPKGRTLGKIKEHLTDIYRYFLRGNEFELVFNNELLRYSEPNILIVPYFKNPTGELKKWKKDINFDFGEDLKAKGFIAIRETADVSRAGLALFRRNRLIQGSGDEGYRPEKIFGKSNSFEYQRIFGEIFLDGFAVSHTKDGFKWDENEEVFLDLLKEELMKDDLPLIQQARGYRTRLNPEKIKKEINKAVTNTATSIQKQVPPIIKKITDTKDSSELPENLVKAHLKSYRAIELEYKEEKWQILIELSMDRSVGNWLEISDFPFPSGIKQNPSAQKTSLRLSLTHPFTERFAGVDASEIESLIRVAAALGLAEVVARKSGVKLAGTIRRNFNELIKVLSD